VTAVADAHLRDLLYLDEEKAASIYSQIFGGVVEGTQESSESAKGRRGGLGLNIGPLRPELGLSSETRSSVIESRVLHHHLLLEIEQALEDLGALVDVNQALGLAPSSEEAVRAAVGGASYVRVEGWTAFEDYDRISGVVDEWGPLVEFINSSARFSLEQSEEFKGLRASFEEQKTQARLLPDKNQQRRALKEIGEQERALDALLEAAASSVENPLEDWFVEGFKRWLRVFLPGRVTLRVYPFENVPRFQVFGNLKRDAFVDADLGNLLFAYGVRPNVKLTAVGLITSLPAEADTRFDPLTEFRTAEDGAGAGIAVESGEVASDDGDETPVDHDGEDPGEEGLTYEQAFRGVFAGMEGMENLARFSRYPNVTVYPLAVYRRVPVVEPEGG
jgi:hypothetical protein